MPMEVFRVFITLMALVASAAAQGECQQAQPTVTNGVVTGSPGDDSPGGGIVNGGKYLVACNPGYVVNGNFQITCTNGVLSATPTCQPGWKDKPSGVTAYDLDSTPIEVVTNMAVGDASASGKVHIKFYEGTGGDKKDAGEVVLQFGESASYNLIGCMSSPVQMDTSADSAIATRKVNVWKFTRTNDRSKFKIQLNDDITILDDALGNFCSDDAYIDGNWGHTAWGKAGTAFEFDTSDTASLKYRAQSTEASVVCTKDEAVLIRGTTAGCSESWYMDMENTDALECRYGGTSKILSTKLHQCGTSVNYNATYVNYDNQPSCGFPSVGNDANEIVRDLEKLINYAFTCSYLRTGTLNQPSWSVPGSTTVELTGESYLEFALKVYNQAFDAEETNFPMPVTLNSDLYMQLSVESDDPGLVLGIVEIRATTNSDSDASGEGISEYLLWNNGCPSDSTATNIAVADYKKKRFSFKVFKFVNNAASQIYIHAKVKVCDADDTTECLKTCEARRRRQATIAESGSDENLYNVSLGPFVTTDPNLEEVAQEVSGVCPNMGYDILLLTVAPLSSIFWN